MINYLFMIKYYSKFIVIDTEMVKNFKFPISIVSMSYTYFPSQDIEITSNYIQIISNYINLYELQSVDRNTSISSRPTSLW